MNPKPSAKLQSLVRSPARIVSGPEATLLDAYEISAEKDHDVYDSFILALAREYGAEYLLTTDTDFEEPCAGEDVRYTNPIPTERLETLALTDG